LKICLLIADVQIALRTTVVLKQVLAAKSVNFQYQIQQKPQFKYVNPQSTTLAVIWMAGLAKSLKHRCCSTFVSRKERDNNYKQRIVKTKTTKDIAW